MEKLLSIGDIARMLDLSIATIYKYVCQKKIPYLKIGSRVLFDEDKLDKWLQSKEVEVFAAIYAYWDLLFAESCQNV